MSFQLPKDKTIIYVTREWERAIIPTYEKNYYIATNKPNEQKASENFIFPKENELLDTWQLLEDSNIVSFIKKQKNPHIVVFKNTPRIERICQEQGWTLLNPSAELAAEVENKISQFEWLGGLQKYLPNTKIILGEELEWNEKIFIVQFNRAHTGEGTMVIKSKDDVEQLKKNFPKRPLRISNFIDGPMFTVNVSIANEKVIQGSISYQITGLSPFTDNKFATIGNDWSLPDKILNDEQKSKFDNIVLEIGKKLQKDGWKGLFGVDIIFSEAEKKMYLIEINARQPASATYESILQKHKNPLIPSIIEIHLSSLLDIETKEPMQNINSGSQIVLRVNKKKPDLAKLQKELARQGFGRTYAENTENIIPYSNKKEGKDLLRIQTSKNIMKNHNELSDLGKEIAHICQ